MIQRKALLDMLTKQLDPYPDVMEGIIFLPEVGEFLKITEGSGDNLDRQDYDAGYVDYLNLDIYKLVSDDYFDELKLVNQDLIPVIGDSGLFLLKELYQEQYAGKFAAAIVDSIEFAYDSLADISIAFYIPKPTENQMRDYENQLRHLEP